MLVPSATPRRDKVPAPCNSRRLGLEVLENRLLPGEGVLGVLLGAALAGSFGDPALVADFPPDPGLTAAVAVYRASTAQPFLPLPAPARAVVDTDSTANRVTPVYQASATNRDAVPFGLGNDPLRALLPSHLPASSETAGGSPAAIGNPPQAKETPAGEHTPNASRFTPPPVGPAPVRAAQPGAGVTDRLAAAMATAQPAAVAPTPTAATLPASDNAQLNQALAGLPVQFEVNVGQAAAGAAYVVHAQGYAATLNADGLTYQADQGALQVHLVGANSHAKSVATQPSATQVAYFVGSPDGNPADNGRSFAPPVFGSVTYQNVYQGVNVVYHGDGQGRLEYDFVVAPGADAGAIALQFQGARGVRLDAQGNLLADTPAGTIRQNKPVLYQDVGGQRRPVDGGFVLEGTTAHFRVGAHDATRPLVIDPVVFSSFLGNSLGSSAINAVSVGSVGWAQKVYVTGYLPGPLGFTNLFFSEIDYTAAANTAVVKSVAYFGGTGPSFGRGIATDRANPDIAYVVGTSSAGAFYTKKSLYAVNGQTAVVMRFDTSRPVQNSVDYAVAAAGFGADTGLAVSADFDWWHDDPANGGGAFFAISVFNNGIANPYIIHLLGPNGVTGPVVGGVREGVRESVMTDGSAFLWSNPAATSPQIYGMDVTPAPTQPRYLDGTFDYHVHVIGTAVDLNVVPGAPRPWVGHFVTGHRNSGGVPVVLANLYSTPLGFLGYGTGIAVDPAQVSQVSGLKTNYSVVAVGQALNNLPGGIDLWLARFDAFDSGSVQAVYRSPGGLYTAVGLAVEQQALALQRPAGAVGGLGGPGGGGPPGLPPPSGSTNNIYVTGTINVNGTPQAHVTKFLPDLRFAQAPVVFGGTGGDIGRSIALAGSTNALGGGLVFVAGMTGSPDFAVRNPFQPVMAAPPGGTDGFLTALAQGPGGL